MTVEMVDATVADFDAHFEKLYAAGDDGGKVKLLLFLADRDPSSSLTWCPGNKKASRFKLSLSLLWHLTLRWTGSGCTCRLQRGGAGDLREAGGPGQGRAAPARLRRRQADVEGPGPPVEGGPAVQAQGRPDADAVGEGRRRGAARGRRGPRRRQDRRRP